MEAVRALGGWKNVCERNTPDTVQRRRMDCDLDVVLFVPVWNHNQ